MRNSYLQQSPMTDETISLDDFDQISTRYIKIFTNARPLFLGSYDECTYKRPAKYKIFIVPKYHYEFQISHLIL